MNRISPAQFAAVGKTSNPVFHTAVARALEIYAAQPAGKKDLCWAASLANQESGDTLNTTAVQTAAYKILYA